METIIFINVGQNFITQQQNQMENINIQSNKQMSTPQRSATHYFFSEGRLVQKPNDFKTQPVPKTIHYTHSIRMITPFTCDHQHTVNQLNQRHSVEIQGKNREIQNLRQLLLEKDEELSQMKRDRQLQKLNSQNKLNSNNLGFKLQIQKFEEYFHSEVSGLINESNVQKRRFSNIELLHPDNQCEEQEDQVLKIKNQMKSTMDALANITNMLQKPRKKYNFYNPKFCQREYRISNSSVDKRLNQTNIMQNDYQNKFQQNQLNETFIQIIQNPNRQYEEPTDSDGLETDETLSNSSQDTEHFLEQMLSEHRILKQSLIDLQMANVKQMEDMRNYYQNQIKTYIHLLGGQRQKFEKGMNSSRTHLQSQEDDQGNEGEDYGKCGLQMFNENVFQENGVEPPDIIIK